MCNTRVGCHPPEALGFSRVPMSLSCDLCINVHLAKGCADVWPLRSSLLHRSSSWSRRPLYRRELPLRSESVQGPVRCGRRRSASLTSHGLSVAVSPTWLDRGGQEVRRHWYTGLTAASGKDANYGGRYNWKIPLSLQPTFAFRVLQAYDHGEEIVLEGYVTTDRLHARSGLKTRIRTRYIGSPPIMKLQTARLRARQLRRSDASAPIALVLKLVDLTTLCCNFQNRPSFTSMCNHPWLLSGLSPNRIGKGTASCQHAAEGRR